jgi:hypothetical protein
MNEGSQRSPGTKSTFAQQIKNTIELCKFYKDQVSTSITQGRYNDGGDELMKLFDTLTIN